MVFFAMGIEKSLGWDAITAKFFKKFWQELSKPITFSCNKTFLEGSLEESSKKRFIKPLPKQVRCYLLKNGHPISMMKYLFKTIANVIASRLLLILGNIVTPHSCRIIKGRSIYDNILATIIGIDYAKLTKKGCILLQ